jgi:hypothetical protein
VNIYQTRIWVRRASIFLFLGVCVVALAYGLVGHRLIDVLYGGSTGTFLDKIMEGRQVHGVTHYYAVANRLVYNLAVPLLLLSWTVLALTSRSRTWVLILLLTANVLLIGCDFLFGSAAGFNQSNFSIRKDAGFAEFFQYLQFFAIIIMFYWLFLHSRDLLHVAWLVLFVYLLVDDSLRIHERLGAMVAQYLHLLPVIGLRAKDLGELSVSAFFGSLILVLLGLGYYRAPPTLQRASRPLLGLLILLAFCGIIVDMVGMMIYPSMWAIDAVFGVLEEGGEMVSISLMAWYVHGLTLASVSVATSV